MDDAVRLAARLRGTALLKGCGKFSMLKMKGILKSKGSFSYLISSFSRGLLRTTTQGLSDRQGLEAGMVGDLGGDW